MTDFSTITPGTLPAGTEVPTANGPGIVLRSSYTAYEVATGPFTVWVPFYRIHGKPEPVTPLVTFG